jgi:hypothetical protein
MYTENTILIANEASSSPVAQNAAVQRCCDARLRAFEVSKAKDENFFDTKQRAEAAYHGAMPTLCDHQSLLDFIACVTHGMVIGAIDSIDGPRLLYAAQVATCAFRPGPKKRVYAVK